MTAVQALAAVAVMGLLGAMPAWAHAGVDLTAPRNGSVLAKAPSAVTVTFDEPVDLDNAWLTGPTGARLPSTARVAGAAIVISPTDALPRGPIAASWQVRSDDGHEVTGSIAFIIGQPKLTGASQRVTLSPTVPARISGSSAGLLTLTFGTALAGGQVEWSSASVREPITWTVTGRGASSRATGVLPVPGEWTIKASLIRSDGSVVVTSGTVTLR